MPGPVPVGLGGAAAADWAGRGGRQIVCAERGFAAAPRGARLAPLLLGVGCCSKSDALEAAKSEEAELVSFSEHCCKNKRVSADITRSFRIYDME